MQVALFHNPAAGSENHTAEELFAWIENAGHHIVTATDCLRELKATVVSGGVELVAVAGGDGTLSAVTCHLASLPCAITILPFGTANDVALSLGLTASPEELIASWEGGTIIPFDLGTLSCQRTETRATSQCFAEAVGWGVFADLVAASETLPRDEDHLARLRSDRSRFRETLSVARPRTYRIIADDVDLSGDYLLVEVLNVPFIGPRIRLNQKSNTSDGLLELVLVSERERADLLAILDAAPGARSVLLPCVQALRVQVASWDRSAHLDGQVLRVDYPDEKTFSLEIATRSTKLLVPQSTAGAPSATIAKRKGMHR